MPEKSAELLAKMGVGEADPSPALDRLVEREPVRAGDPLFPRSPRVAARHRRSARSRERRRRRGGRRGPAKVPQERQEEALLPEDRPGARRVHRTAVSTEPTATETPAIPLIEYDDFAKVALRVGAIVSAERHPNADTEYLAAKHQF